MDLINQEFTFTISGLALISVAIVAVIGIISILIFIVHLLNRIRYLQKPRYGFLGKPLYSLLVLMLMLAGLGFVSYGFTQDNDLVIEASRTVDSNIKTDVIISETNTALVEFSVVPFVDGKAWNSGSTNFDFYWNIRGPESIDQFEFDKNRANPGGFQTRVKKGTYKIRVVIVYKDKSYTFEETRTF